jgi:ABC-type branched-subunit amino acid transport system substrate-binding protein
MFGPIPIRPARTHRLAMAAVAAIAVTCLAACGSGSSSSSGGGYKVGVVLQLSGVGSVYADATQAGIKAGVNDVNGRKVAGRTITTDLADAGSDAQSASSTCSRLVQQDKVSALVVFVPGPQLIACNAIAKRTNVPVLSLSSGAGNICAPNLVSLGLVPNQQSLPVISYLMGTGEKSWYFFGADYSTPRSTIAIAKPYVTSHGGTVVGESYEPMGTSDYSQDIDRIVAAHPQVAFLNVVGNDDVALEKQWAADPRTKGIERVDILLGEGEAKALGSAGTDIWSSNAYFSSITGAGNDTFKADVRKAGLSGQPDVNAYVSYMQIEVLAAAVKKAGSDTGAVGTALRTASVDGPVGTLAVKSAFSFQPVYLAQAQADGSTVIRKEVAAIDPQLSCTAAS